MHADTCILLFSRTPQSERHCKHLAKGEKQNARIIERLFRQSRQVIKASGLPYLIATEGSQQGHSFGLRLSHSLASLFAKGYSKAIIVGNDCPQLQSKDLIKAAKALEQGHQLSGPTPDGGSYLIGISKNCFDPSAFEQLPWESAHIHKALLDYFHHQQAQYQELRCLSDVNDHHRLQVLLPVIRHIDYLKVILNWCQPVRPISTQVIYFSNPFIGRQQQLRGPPALVA